MPQHSAEGVIKTEKKEINKGDAQHCEHCEGHEARLDGIEAHLGIGASGGMPVTSPKSERLERNAKMYGRKRS
jgi:hypothetical protein